MIAYYNEKSNSKIRVFISSTFRDMQRERNIIVNSIFPMLRRAFRGSMIDIMEIDLRWGISEQDIRDMTLLEICIGETLNCTPFFVGLIGDFYGTLAKSEEIKMLPPKYKRGIGMKSPTDIPEGVSLTELEMRAGAFIKHNTEFARFFVRGTEADERDAEKLSNLIEGIECNGFNVEYYGDIDEFERTAYDSLFDLIESILPKELEPPNKDTHYFSHLRVLRDKNLGYIPNEELVGDTLEILENSRKLYIYGGKGTGKSALLSHLAVMEGNERCGNVFFHFADADEESLSSENLYKRLRLYLEGICGITSSEFEDRNAVIEILRLTEFKEPVTLCFDAVEKLPSRSLSHELFSLADINPSVRIIESSAQEHRRVPKAERLDVLPLSSEQMRQLVVKRLHNFGKKLAEEQMEQIIATEACKNPLFLSALTSQLIMYGHHESFGEFFEKILASRGFDELFKIIIERIDAYFTERDFDTEAIYRALSLIIHSKSGIPESELGDISGLRPIEKSVLITAIDLFTTDGDCLVRFNHDLIIKAAKEILSARDFDYEKYASEAFISYFTGEKANEGYWRKYTELPHHLYKTKSCEALMSALSDIECFSYLAENQFTTLVKYLALLRDSQSELAGSISSFLSPKNAPLFANAFCQAGAYRAALLLILAALGGEADGEDAATLEDAEALADKIEGSSIACDAKIALFRVAARSYYKTALARYEPAVKMYERLLAFFKGCYPDDELGYISSYYLLGVTYKTAGDVARSRECLEYCANSVLSKNIKSDASHWMLAVYANILFLSGEVGDASKIMSAAIEDARFLFGESSDELAWAYSYAWPVRYSMGEKNAAAAMARSAHQIHTEAYGDRGPKIAWSATNLGSCEHIYGKYTEARELYLLSIRENNAAVSEEKRPHVYTLTTYANLAVLEYNLGNKDEAVRLIDFALEHSRKKNGSEHLYTANILLTSGIIKGSAELIREAISVYEKKNSPDRYFAVIVLARILAGEDKEEESAELVEALFKEHGKDIESTELLLYLLAETLEKVSWCAEDFNLSPMIEKLTRYKDYKHYLFYNNTSNIAPIPHI